MFTFLSVSWLLVDSQGKWLKIKDHCLLGDTGVQERLVYKADWYSNLQPCVVCDSYNVTIRPVSWWLQWGVKDYKKLLLHASRIAYNWTSGFHLLWVIGILPKEVVEARTLKNHRHTQKAGQYFVRWFGIQTQCLANFKDLLYYEQNTVQLGKKLEQIFEVDFWSSKLKGKCMFVLLRNDVWNQRSPCGRLYNLDQI